MCSIKLYYFWDGRINICPVQIKVNYLKFLCRHKVKSNPFARRWVNSTTLRLTYPRERQGIHWTGDWMSLTADVDGIENLASTRISHNSHGFVFCPYCATHTTQTSMPPAGFEPATPLSGRSQTLVLDRSATGIGIRCPDRPACSESLYRLSYPSGRSAWKYVLCVKLKVKFALEQVMKEERRSRGVTVFFL